MPSGSDILVIWIELLVLAGQINDCGSVYFNHEVPYTTDLLSAQFDYPPTTIQLALATFSKFGMIEIIDDIIKISNWQRYQNEEAMARIKLMNAERQRRHREKVKEQKLLLEGGECSCNVTGNVTGNVTSNENCSIYISNISSLSKDNEDKDKGCGEKEKEPKKGRKAFVKPTVEEIAAYCKERKNGIDAQEFYDKYEANGWVVGRNGNPMKDWMATVRTWENFRKGNPNAGKKAGTSTSPYKPDGTYDYEGGESEDWASV